MEAIGKSVDSTKKKLADYNEGMSYVGRNSVKIGATMVASIGGAFALCAKNAIEFESAWTGVLKTVKGSDTQLENIKNQMRPNDFVAYYKNADFIITDSFHGTCFAILFKKCNFF